MRPPRIALLLVVTLAACGGDDAPRPERSASLGEYAATTDSLCAKLASAVRRTFAEVAIDPVAALSHYARDVHDAGRRFSATTPPPELARFHAAAVRHLARESAALRRAAELSAAGNPAGALESLHLTGLLPDRIPQRVLRRAPACRGSTVPGTPHESAGTPV